MARKLRANKGIGKYKNTDAYLNAVYRKNKDLINKGIPPINNNGKGYSQKTRFKNIVKSYIGRTDEDTGKKITIKQALDIVSKSRVITSKGEHYSSNFYSGLKKDKQAFRIFRKKNGWSTKIDEYGFEYVGTEGKYDVYEYGGKIRIKKPFSPKSNTDGIIIEDI